MAVCDKHGQLPGFGTAALWYLSPGQDAPPLQEVDSALAFHPVAQPNEVGRGHFDRTWL